MSRSSRQKNKRNSNIKKAILNSAAIEEFHAKQEEVAPVDEEVKTTVVPEPEQEFKIKKFKNPVSALLAPGVSPPIGSKGSKVAVDAVTFNGQAILGYDYNIVSPGDVVLTKGVFPEELSGSVLGKESRPAIVLAAEHGLMLIVAVSTHNGYEGTVTCRRCIKLPAVTKDLAAKGDSTYVDISQVHTADQSTVCRIVAKINPLLIDFIADKLYQWIVIERGGQTSSLLSLIKKERPEELEALEEIQKLRHLEATDREATALKLSDDRIEGLEKQNQKLLEANETQGTYVRKLESEVLKLKKQLEASRASNESLLKELAELQAKKEEQPDPGMHKAPNVWSLEHVLEANTNYRVTGDREQLLMEFNIPIKSRSDQYRKFNNLREQMNTFAAERGYKLTWE